MTSSPVQIDPTALFTDEGRRAEHARLEALIFERWPLIFRDRTKPMSETCMCWGLELGVGWAPLIDSLCEALTYTYTTAGDTRLDGSDEYWPVDFPQVVCDQCKTKMSTLRFYSHLEYSADFQAQAERFPNAAAKLYAAFDAYVDGVIHLAEVQSARTCENTGRPGFLHSSGGSRYGWLMTLCPEEAARLGYAPYSTADEPDATDTSTDTAANDSP